MHTTSSSARASGHLLPLLFCLLLASGFWYISAVHYGDDLWSDDVDYLMIGKSIVQEGRFPPAPIPYEAFLDSGATTYGQTPYSYPNLGFSTVVGLLGQARGDFSLWNGIYVNGLFTLAFAAAAYGMLFSLTRSRAAATLVPCLVMLFAYKVLGQALTDTSLLFFLAVSMWAALSHRHGSAGFLLGLGYLFREHALIFLPLLPLLSDKVVSLKSYARALLAMIAGFAPWVLLAKGASLFLAYGTGFADFYASGVPRKLEWSLEAIRRFCGHMLIFLRTVWVPLLFLGYCALRKRLSSTALRLIAVIFIHNIVVFALWSYKDLPERYLIYSFLFLYPAVFLSLPELKTRRAPLLALVLLSLVAQYRNIGREIRYFSGPAGSISVTDARIRAPHLLPGVLPRDGVIMANQPTLALYAGLDKGIRVEPLPFSAFLQHDNSRIDGILLRKENNGWKTLPAFTDAAGNRFVRIELPGPVPRKHCYYAREKNSGQDARPGSR